MTSKVYNESNIVENNQDVFILSTLIRDHLRKTNGRDLNLSEILQKDTLKRISNNFEKIELKTLGGYISVYYKFSDFRDLRKSVLNETEREKIKNLKWTVKDYKKQYNGEIQFDYGERFYRIRKIISSHKSTVASTRL